MKAYETGHAEPDDYLASPIYRVSFWDGPRRDSRSTLTPSCIVDASGVDEGLQ